MRSFLGLVVALPAEGRCLLGPGRWQPSRGVMTRRSRLPDGTPLVCARRGTGRRNAASASQWLIAEGTGALINLGVSGGLWQGLRPGDLVLAERVVEKGMTGERAFEADRGCADLAHTALRMAGMPVQRGAVFCASRALLTAEEKQALHNGTPALAVDMESAAVARAAAGAGLPFFILRAVCDPVERRVDEDLFSCLGEDGQVRWPVLLKGLGRRPSLLGGLLRARKDFLLALKSLRQAWQVQTMIGLPKRLLSG